MDAKKKRMSFSCARNECLVDVTALSADSEEWIKAWREVYARDLIESHKIISIDAESSVEEACDALLKEDSVCLAVKSPLSESYLGLFDFSDVNAFLTFAATRHTLMPQEVQGNSQVDQIVAAAKAGRVPVRLVSNLSEKNPLAELPYEASILSLLAVFAQGRHRVLIKSPSPSTGYEGIVSDRQLLAWFYQYSESTPSFAHLLSNSLQSLSLPSLNIFSAVVAATSSTTLLDAMKLMSDEGVSSVAVVDDETGHLLSAVSVTDVGKIVVPSQSNQILSTSLKQFVSQIKGSDGSTDGADKYPVYSVLPTSVLSFTIQKLLATNAHRLFVTTDASANPSPGLAPALSSNLSGIVSIVDILSLFARIAHIQNVDPTSMRRHRRASSASSHSSQSQASVSRSNSRTSLRQSLTSPGVVGGGVMVGSPGVGEALGRKSPPASNADGHQWSERASKRDSWKGDGSGL